MAERAGLASLTDLAYIFLRSDHLKVLPFCTLVCFLFLSDFAYISRPNLCLSTSRKLLWTNCYSLHYLNNLSRIYHHLLHCAVSARADIIANHYFISCSCMYVFSLHLALKDWDFIVLKYYNLLQMFPKRFQD